LFAGDIISYVIAMLQVAANMQKNNKQPIVSETQLPGSMKVNEIPPA
jgi:hypothetical protein